jgi:hypothetical protein
LGQGCTKAFFYEPEQTSPSYYGISIFISEGGFPLTLAQMREIDIRTINPEEVADAQNIEIDINLPVVERFKNYKDQSGNPYFIKVGNVIVKMGFAKTTDTANDCFERYMRTC